MNDIWDYQQRLQHPTILFYHEHKHIIVDDVDQLKDWHVIVDKVQNSGAFRLRLYATHDGEDIQVICYCPLNIYRVALETGVIKPSP